MKIPQIYFALAVTLPFKCAAVVAQTQLNQNEILGSLQEGE